MKKMGFLFPGQGAQAVGMGRNLYEASPEARAIFDAADEQLGFPISKLCFEGPDEELVRTANAQIAIFVTSLAALSALCVTLPQLKPSLACGLSLGEFTALVSLNAITFGEGLQLVRRRGELMEEACQKQPGIMASVLGLSVSDCESICRQTGAELANLNSYEQVVISGTRETVESACQLAEQRGAKRTIFLKVGGAFHSSLMQHAKQGLEKALAKIKISEPSGVFIPNATGTPTSNPEEIRTLLAKQLTSPVQWVKTMETARQLGVTRFMEVGPGRVLKGLAKKMDANLKVLSIGTREDLEGLKPSSVVCL